MAVCGLTFFIFWVGGSIFAPACNALRPGGGGIYATTARIGLGGRLELFLVAPPHIPPNPSLASLHSMSMVSARPLRSLVLRRYFMRKTSTFSFSRRL